VITTHLLFGAGEKSVVEKEIKKHMYTRLNNQSLAPAQADTWLLYTLAQIMASLLWPVPIVGSTDKGSISRSLPEKFEAAKGGPIRPQPDLLLWLSDEGDPYLQTPLMCIRTDPSARLLWGTKEGQDDFSTGPCILRVLGCLPAKQRRKAPPKAATTISTRRIRSCG